MQADRQRDQGAAADVKKFHNQVKRLLLQRFAGGKDRLLDLACGRGGDLLKWIDCKLKYVRGYDIAAQEVWLAIHWLYLCMLHPSFFAVFMRAHLVATGPITSCRLWCGKHHVAQVSLALFFTLPL